MPQLLLELGTEELPASAVRRAYHDLGIKIATSLQKESLLEAAHPGSAMGTPRRLIVAIDNVAERQPDSERNFRGPALKGAYDEGGNPTPALLGFCRGQGVDPSRLWQEGQYVWVTKKIEGRSAIEILSELLPTAIRSLAFDKTMRWGAGKMRFARPIRWVLASFGGEPVPFELEGVTSGRQSYGHRFYAPGPFEAGTFEELVFGLRERKVEPDPDRRKAMILKSLPDLGGHEAKLYPELLDENVFLTEWPTPIVGSFSEGFLELPTPVLTTVMAKHEKMFPVWDGLGSITSKFVFIRNAGEDDSVRKGCEWVLNARMNDAKFFFDEDARLTLDDFREKTQTIVFQETLGTVWARSERLAELAVVAAPVPNDSDDELEQARMAGRYAKADLSTGLVGELASLQGVVGSIYGQKMGLSESVCFAIAAQYATSLSGRTGGGERIFLSEAGKSASPAVRRTTFRLIMADQIDKLAGYLGLGLEPTGSSDPYGLRRAVSLLIEAAWEWPAPLEPYSSLLIHALNHYQAQGVQLDRQAALDSLGRLFSARYSHLLTDVRHDILEAATSAVGLDELTSPKDILFRARLLQSFTEKESFVQTATRPLNILTAALKKGLGFHADGELTQEELAKVDSPSAEALYAIAGDLKPALEQAVSSEDLEAAHSLLLDLQLPIHAFFEETLVMAEDPDVRYGRLTVVSAVSLLLLQAGDFTKLVFAGAPSSS